MASSTSTKIYEDVQSYGRFMSTLWLIVAAVFGGIFILVGIFSIFRKAKYTAQTIGEIINKPTCIKIPRTSDKEDIKYDCTDIKLSYKVNDTVYSPTKDNVGSKYQHKDKPIIFYNPKDPSDFSFNSDASRAFGIVFIIIGLIIISVGYFSYYVSHKYAFGAASTGISSGLGIISSGID